MLKILLRKELLESIRSYRMLIWAVVCAFFGILSPVAAYYMPNVLEYLGSSQNMVFVVSQVTYTDALEQYIKNFTQIGSIIIIFLTMGLVAAEKEDGLLQFLWVRPISAAVILLAKAISLVCMVFLGLCLATVLTSIYTIYLFKAFPVMLFVQSNVFLLLYLLVIGCISLSFSAMLNKPLSAGLCSLGVWLVFSVLGSLGNAGWYSFTRLGQQVMRYVEGFPISLKPVFSAILIIIVCFVCARFVFKRWESTS